MIATYHYGSITGDYVNIARDPTLLRSESRTPTAQPHIKKGEMLKYEDYEPDQRGSLANRRKTWEKDFGAEWVRLDMARMLAAVSN